MIEKLHLFYPDGQVDILLRKGNEGLFKNHPHLNNIIIWDKQKKKYKNLIHIIQKLRTNEYDHILNLQRFATTGFLTWMIKGKEKTGFAKNPFSFCYHRKLPHVLNKGIHEVDRNISLIKHLTDDKRIKPKLYPGKDEEKFVSQYKTKPYICMAPTSVWFTKQAPEKLWIDLINKLSPDFTIYLLGGKTDIGACENIIKKCNHNSVKNLSGKLNLLESAALMKYSAMNYVNDSAPLHLASAVNAPTTAVFCSTVPEFGFGPLSDNSRIVEIDEPLYCRPCGLHGYKECPEGHFKCGNLIKTDKMLINEGQ